MGAHSGRAVCAGFIAVMSLLWAELAWGMGGATTSQAAIRTKAESTPPVVHRVSRGQTLGGIARRYSVTVNALCRANRLSRKGLLQLGQRLLIPLTDKPASPQQISVLSPKEVSSKAAAPAAPLAVRSGPARPLPAASSWRAFRQPAPKAGYVKLRGTAGAYSGYAVLEGDRLSPKAVAGFRRVLASWRTGKQIDISDRLIRLLVKTSDTFGGRALIIVGGYREHSYAKASKHHLGHAVDFAIEDVPNTALRDFLRTQSRVGVGFYPNSSFVHLDVRARSAYWVDQSRPGQRPIYVPVPAPVEPVPTQAPLNAAAPSVRRF